MPLQTIRLRPGVNVELTPTANLGGWSSSQLIRFFAGQLQKLGGWTRLAGQSVAVGVIRSLFSWSDQLGLAHLAIGTDQRLYVMNGGARYDITPIVHTSNIAPAFQTTAGAATVLVLDNGYQPEPGDWINLTVPVTQGGLLLSGLYQVQTIQGGFGYDILAASPATQSVPSGGAVAVVASTSASATITVTLPGHGLSVGASFTLGVTTLVGGIPLSGTYPVAAVLDASRFQIIASALANATASVTVNSGLMQIQYLLASGSSIHLTLDGWGMGDFGLLDYGQSSSPGTGFTIPPRLWSLDHFGQDLIASPDKGAIYYWAPPDPTPAIVVAAAAPTVNTIVLAVAQAQIIVACGSSVAGTQYPTLIRWCDSGDFTDWVASVSNQAGSYQLPTGSYITAALSTGLGLLIWTDIGLWTMTYQGLPYVFGFNSIGVNCEALARKAVAAVGALVIWPSSRGFFVFEGGTVSTIECPVWDVFFNDLDSSQSDLVFAATNTLYSEVAWYFPTVAGTTRYVKYNYLEKVWDYGSLDRTAWIDHSPFGLPIGADSAGVLYDHESGNDADGGALVCYGQSAYYELREGSDISVVKVLIPDAVASANSQLQLTVLATDYPNATAREYGPYTVLPTTKRVNVSLRGRQIAFRFSSQDLGSAWRIGAMRFAVQPAGTRP